MKTLAKILVILAVLMAATPASAWIHGAPASAERPLLARLYSGWPQQNSFFPLGVFFLLTARTGANDNITSICQIGSTVPATGTTCSGGTQITTGYPAISGQTNYGRDATNCPASPTTITQATGTAMTGAANMGANVFVVLDGQNGSGSWPEGFGCDYGETTLAYVNGMYIIGGTAGSPAHYPLTDPLDDTSFWSVNSQITTAVRTYTGATGQNGAPTLIGHFAYDEPTCPTSAGAPKYVDDSIGSWINLNYFDKVDSAAASVGTRPTYSNQFGAWVRGPFGSGGPSRTQSAGLVFAFPCGTNPSWTTCPNTADGNAFTNYAGFYCNYNSTTTLSPQAMFMRGLQRQGIGTYDDYTQINVGLSTGYLYGAVSDGVYPNDRIYLQALTMTNMVKMGCPANGTGTNGGSGQYSSSPVVTVNGLSSGENNCSVNNAQSYWATIEAASDALATQGNTINVNLVASSPTITINTTGCSFTCPSFGVASAPNCTFGTPACSAWVGIGVTDATAYLEVLDPTCANVHITPNLVGGQVTSYTINNAGTGCSSSPISFVANAGTKTLSASATLTVSGGSIATAVPVGLGSGYTTASVSITSTAGGGGAITANIVGGQITSYTVTSPGSGYSGVSLHVTGDGTGALASAVVSGGNITAAVPTGYGYNYAGGTNCIPFGTTIASVPGPGPRSATATLSTKIGTSAGCTVTDQKIAIVDNPDNIVTHGFMTACRYSLGNEDMNICPNDGRRFRTTALDVTAEAWEAIIAGARGILWFQQDACSNEWGLGGNSGVGCLQNVYYAGQAAANISLLAMQYENLLIKNYATQINASVLGACSPDYVPIVGSGAQAGTDMMNTDPGTHTFPYCTNGILTLQSNVKSYPAEAMITHPGSGLTGPYYLFTEALRCSEQNCHSVTGTLPAGVTWDNTSGGTITYTLAGLGGKTATVIYDSACHFLALTPCKETNTHVLDGGGGFSELLGNGGDNTNYEVVIYSIQ
jgi:hypothetical protein